MTERNFGSADGLGSRLAYWANQLSRNRNYPWVGTGLIDDLKCAAKLHGADFDALFPLEIYVPPKDPPPPPPPPAPVQREMEASEYDL